MVNLGPTEYYDPRPGDIGLVRISGAGGKIIRGLQWANGCGFEDFEHAVGVTQNYGGRVAIVEAEPGGAVHVDMHYPSARWLVCPDGLRELMTENLIKLVGTPYSWADYAAIGAHRFHLPGGSLLRHHIETSKHLMCSQLVDRAASLSGWHLFDDGRWEGYVPPCDLNKLWHKHYELHNGTAY